MTVSSVGATTVSTIASGVGGATIGSSVGVTTGSCTEPFTEAGLSELLSMEPSKYLTLKQSFNSN